MLYEISCSLSGMRPNTGGSESCSPERLKRGSVFDNGFANSLDRRLPEPSAQKPRSLLVLLWWMRRAMCETMIVCTC